MATIIAVANQKGGCGKTTTTINLAGGLSRAPYRVKVVDADPQGSSLIWSLSQGQGTLPFDVVAHRQVRSIRDEMLDEHHDITIFDCPAGVADDRTPKIARDAVSMADLILIPIMPSTLDFSAARSFVRYLNDAKGLHTAVFALLNATQHTRLSQQARTVAEDLLAPLGGVVLQSTIGRRAPITEVSGTGKTIFDYARPNSPATKEYTALTKEIIQCLTDQPSSSTT